MGSRKQRVILVLLLLRFYPEIYVMKGVIDINDCVNNPNSIGKEQLSNNANYSINELKNRTQNY